jgi:transglutaminase-like putative cysteine protease
MYPMNRILKITKYVIFLAIFLSGITYINARTEDFKIDNNTRISYKTGDDFVTVRTEYIREVKNSKYYYSTDGEKVFHIPDLPKSKDYEIELERQFKMDFLKVTDGAGKSIKYSTETLPIGEGVYVKVPNYRQTTYGNPYRIVVEYKTHDLIKKINNYIVIQAPSLHADTQFEQIDKASGTRTTLVYNLSIVTDRDIPSLAKVFPSTYNSTETKDSVTYTFFSKDRIGQSPYLEFGTNQTYRFELKYITPKTDNLISQKYSSKFKALSTNIYEISLPRDFSETKQRVKIDEIFPTPTRIAQDNEGNILARFEVPANKRSEIYITGYIWVEQDTYENRRAIPDMKYSEYIATVSNNSNLKNYLLPSKYWEIKDPYIKQEAEKILEGRTHIMDIIRANYSYVNDRLDYDDSKAASENERIGAKAALQGGGSVCMEYADSMIALLRAQGIVARAALGYSNLNVLANTSQDGNTRHQWVQVWIPEYGWLSVDPTYESKNMLIGQNIEKILWETFDGDDISNSKIYSADSISIDEFSDYTVKIYAIDESTLPDESSLKDYSDISLLQENTESFSDVLNVFVKTTTVGKTLIILLPVTILVVTLILSSIALTIGIRKIRTRKAS